ncbi:MAG: DUF4350 domain-containing protein [Flavobacterium nitrogenifigens]|uniref:DUF4350 domain-containing protein n=1 Tax=Flavobacterium nitrogenifigens TaxID=1617283 RepID=UPI0028080FF9|nr:DUF4350 domain-containing protein [Flavobacterium nitrogenifigens]MDQ8014032.1 DUF4350 domain-containing protein [Flavobacterium nitrogenifigens]
MDNKVKIYIAILVLIFGITLLVDKGQPKPIDWTPTYSVEDKIPFGLYVFDQEADGIFKQKIERISTQTPYEYLDSQYDSRENVEKYKIKGSFMNISEVDNIDEGSMREILYFVSHGNNVFLSMKVFPKALLDSLKIELKTDFMPNDSISVWMANKKVSTKKYTFNTGLSDYFSKIDTLNTKVLGYQMNRKNEKQVNFIEVPYKNGHLYLHTQPVAFTNYNLLKKDYYQYAENVLSYIPKGNIFWYNKTFNDKRISSSPMRYIWSQPALKSAWYLGLLGILIFMIFNAKRKQRVVPIIKPLQNLTVDFTKTIGNLYYQEGDHTNIIDKKIIYFLEKIRTDYLLDTTKLDDDFITKLHYKTGKDEKDIRDVVQLINDHRNSYHGSLEEDLIKINTAIEKILH